VCSQVIFSLIPPPGILGGWPCFFLSLAMIGVITAVVGDLASIFGCLIGLKDSVTGKFKENYDQCSVKYHKLVIFSALPISLFCAALNFINLSRFNMPLFNFNFKIKQVLIII
jgi:hypothetical protein